MTDMGAKAGTSQSPDGDPSGRAAVRASGDVADERLGHRGPLQRLLTSPEIGGLIGAVAIWTFFWAVTRPFGTAGGTGNWLDVAATLGIMAVVVSMLMIGGEFDLSAGAMTGSTGILVILLVKDVGELGGAGLNLFLAVPLSLVIALGVGWFNGTTVERTSLPSFIVTLGTFFVLRGAKLGFSKLIIDNIQVGRIDEGEGYEFWRLVFASTWTRNDHTWDGRDLIHNQLLLAGAVLVVIAFFELTFHHRSPMALNAWTGLSGAGAAVAIAGYVGLHLTDGTGANYAFAAAIGAGTLACVAALGGWRYEPAGHPVGFGLDGSTIRNAAIGLGFVALGVVLAVTIDSTSTRTLLLLITEQGLRAILFVSLAVGGILYLARAAGSAGRVAARTQLGARLLAAIVLVGLAFAIQAESASRKFRAELFTVVLLLALLVAAFAVASLASEERRLRNRAVERRGQLLALAGVVLAAAGLGVRLLFTTAAEIEAGVPQASFSVRIVWFLAVTAVAVWLLGRTRFGSWTFAVGGNKEAARQVGVPAARTKTQLFMIVSAGAWLVGMLLAFRLNTLQAGTGNGEEFEYIIAAVVGGNLLTGGYGSAAGGAIGALIMAMSFQGIPFAGWNSDWRFVFLGVILLMAVIANNFIRRRAEAARR
jgi:ribose/xylose/arabinose/galactoside ABC-type transport system permease subunit